MTATLHLSPEGPRAVARATDAYRALTPAAQRRVLRHIREAQGVLCYCQLIYASTADASLPTLTEGRFYLIPEPLSEFTDTRLEGDTLYILPAAASSDDPDAWHAIQDYVSAAL